MARFSRSVGLIVSYLKKINNPERIIDTHVFNSDDINTRIFLAMAHKKRLLMIYGSCSV